MQAITVDIYCRTATDGPDTPEHLDDQEAICRVYCVSHGLCIGTVHREVWSGTEYRNRPALTAIRDRYRQHIIQGVLVTRTDRLSRSLTHLAFLLEEMAQHHVTLYTASEQRQTTMPDSTVELILTAVAELNRENVREDGTNTHRPS